MGATGPIKAVFAAHRAVTANISTFNVLSRHSSRNDSRALHLSKPPASILKKCTDAQRIYDKFILDKNPAQYSVSDHDGLIP
jgi:hypothetical protein